MKPKLLESVRGALLMLVALIVVLSIAFPARTVRALQGPVTLFGTYFSSPPTYSSNGQSVPFSADSNGYLNVHLQAGGTGGGAVTMASGAVASGAYSSGALADGSIATMGTKADSAVTNPSSSASLVGISKGLLTDFGGGLPSALGAGGGLKVDGSGTPLPVLPSPRATAASSSDPSIPNNTSTQLLAAGTYNYIEIDNFSSTSLAISLSGATITSTTPSGSNNVIVIQANSSWHSPPNWVPTAAVTGYQSSGSTISNVTVTAG